MNLNDWHKSVLNTLAHLQRPAAGLSPPPAGGGRERLEILSDVRRLLAPEDHVPEPWKVSLQRWAATLADCHRSYALEALWALALAVDNGIAAALAVRFFGGPVPLAAGVLSGLPTGHALQTLVPDPYVFEGQRSLVLGFALPGQPWRPRPFYPTEMVRRLTTNHRRPQAEGEATERQRQREQADLERWERERNPEYQIASLQKRLAVLENS